MKENIGTIIAIVIAFLAKEMWALYKTRRIQWKKIFNVGRDLEIDVMINDELATLRDRYDFNRAAVIDYSNGITSLAGICFKNFSIRYERVDLITKPIMPECQNLPASSIATFMHELHSVPSGYLIVDDRGDDNMSMMNRVYGTHQGHCFRLGDSLINGCVSLTYTHITREFNNEEINDIKAVCLRIKMLRDRQKS